MRKAFQFVAAHERLFALLLAIFLSVAMMLMGEGKKTYFVRGVTTAVFNTGRFTFSWGIYILDIWRENRRLRVRNLELSDQIARYDNAVRQNEHLRSLLGLKKRLSASESVIAGTVLGHDLDRIVNSLIVDVGTKDGVRKNMAVVTAEGLVGKVFEVHHSSCSVKIIKDMQSRISATAEGINGIIRWEGGPNLTMFGLPLMTTPKPGQKVYTTGFGLYPPGLYIGRVTNVNTGEFEQYASVNVVSDVDFSAVMEVFILIGSERADVWDDGDGEGGFQRPAID